MIQLRVARTLLSADFDVGFREPRIFGPSTTPQLRVEDYEEAARMNNTCRARGIAGSSVDFLVCAVANLRNWQVFTTDRDFIRYRKALSVDLYEAGDPS